VDIRFSQWQSGIFVYDKKPDNADLNPRFYFNKSVTKTVSFPSLVTKSVTKLLF
jgi:hypothetical protein